jgi:zinc protease
MAGKQLMAARPTPGTVTAETSLDAHGVIEWTLSNGVKVVIKPTDFDNDSVLINAFSTGGTVTASDKLFPSARYADSVIGAGGVGELDDVQLGKLLAGQVVSASAWIGETEEGISASGSPEDLETILQLVHQRIVAPRKDDQAFTVWKQRQLEWIKNRRLNPERSFQEDIDAVYNKNHPRRRPAEAADIEKIDLDQALAFYQERFGDVGDFTFVVVGNVDPPTLRPLVETYLASLPAAGRKDKEKDIGLKRPKKVVKKTVERGREPKSVVSLIFHGPQKWSRDDDRDVRILAEVLRIRLREILREEMGGVYGVQVGGGVTRKAPQEHYLSIRFGCAPDNVDKLKQAVFDEIARLKKEGADDDYLERVRKGRLRAREVDLRENWPWVTWLSASYRYGDDLAVVLDLEADLARASSANVKAAAKKFLDEKRYVLGVLVPDPKLVEQGDQEVAPAAK